MRINGRVLCSTLQAVGYLVYMGGLLYFLLPILLFACYDALTFAGAASNGAAVRADTRPAWWSWTPVSLLRSRPLAWFSQITMPFYMVHHEVFGYLERWLPVLPAFAPGSWSNPVASNTGAQIGVVVAWLAAIALSVLLAWALSKYFEPRAARFVEWCLLPSKKPMALPS